jgi:hypothetical protein
MAVLVPAGAAQAAICNQTVTDSGGVGWVQTQTVFSAIGPIGTNYSFALPIVGQSPPTVWAGPAPSGCDSEDGGRELTWFGGGFIGGPTSPGLTLSRKLYVPPDGPAFARVVDTYANASSTPITIDVTDLNPALSPGFIRRTSSGDALASTADDWAVQANTPAGAPTVPVLGQIWQHAGRADGRATQLLNTFGVPWTSPAFSNMFVFGNLTIPANSARSLMLVFLVRPGTDAGLASAIADAPALADAPARLYSGLSQAEQATLVNWPAFDIDGDGVDFHTDNCPTVANAGQGNADGDGQGDACDADDDNDGLPDAAEATLGSNPLSADTDGDGKPDGVDGCLKLASASADGCPLIPTGSALDQPAPVLALTRVAKTLKRKDFLAKGVGGSASCDMPCTVDVELFGTAKSVRLAAGYNVAIGSRSLPLGAGLRKFSVKPSKKLVGGARKLTVQLRVTATSAAGKRTREVRTIKVG